MKHLQKIIRKVGSCVEILVWKDDWNDEETKCVRRNLAPLMITCEAIQNGLNCQYKSPVTRYCLYRLNQSEYANVEVELIKK